MDPRNDRQRGGRLETRWVLVTALGVVAMVMLAIAFTVDVMSDGRTRSTPAPARPAGSRDAGGADGTGSPPPTPDTAPCSPSPGHSKLPYWCPLAPVRGTIDVHAEPDPDSAVVDHLLRPAEPQFFACQRKGKVYMHPANGDHNGWWAKTLGDGGTWGWVNEVYFAGGGNDQADRDLPVCSE